MANIDILELPVAVSLDGSEYFPLVQGATTKRAQTELLAGIQFNLDSISTTQGAILYRNATEWVALTPGTAGYVLTTGGPAADPSWVANGTGTVSSVAMTVPGFLSVAGSPITTSGTLAVTLATQSANTGFFGPTTGGAAAPTFRTLVNADIAAAGAALTRVDDTNVTLTLGGTPSTALVAAASLTLGWTGTLSPARGGTGVANNAASTLTISGNFASTFTVTGITAVTFPTSGTLATTSQILSPGGSTTQLQYNNAGAFGGISGATTNGTVVTLASPVLTTSPTAAGATWPDLGTVTTADINGGTIDGTTIGGGTPAAGTFTTLAATTSNLQGGTATLGTVAGAIDMGGATSLEIPNSAAPTVNADGEIALDTTVTDFSGGAIKYYSGAEFGLVGMPIAEFTSPSDGDVVTYNAATDEFLLLPAGAGTGATRELDNLQNVAINTSLISDTDNTDALGSATIGWADLFLGDGGLINWANGNATITHSTGLLTTNVPVTITGLATASGFAPTANTATGNRLYLPAADTLGFAIAGTGELQLTGTALSPMADGGQSLGTTALGWQNLFGNTGFVFNIENGNWVATHTSGILTVGTGDLRVTNNFTDATSVVTVGGAQTLTNKTLTSPTLTTPALGTPASGTLTNCTGLPISTGVSGLGSGVATMLASATGAVATITFIIDGGGSTITTGIKGDLEIPFACTITQATLLADQSGSIVIDIWKDTYANYPPTDADSITSSTPPTISTAVKSQDSTLTSWTTSVAAGNTLRFNVDSVTSIQRVTLSLRVTKT